MRSAQIPKSGKEIRIHLSRICLTGHAYAAVKARILGDQRFKLFHLFLVSREKLHKACLSSRRALRAEQLQLRKAVLKLVDIVAELIRPERRALADRRKLCGLKVRVCKARQSLVLFRERGEIAHDLRRLFEDDLRRFAQNYHVGVISDVARCRAEVDYPLRLRALFTVCVNVGHNVVSYLAFALFGYVEIDVVAVRFKLRNLLVGYIETELFLSLCKRYPQSSPCAEFKILGKDVLHLCRRIPCGKRGNVFLSVVHI